MHTIIIGDGVTAASFASTVEEKIGNQLTIIGKKIDQLGRGLAYQEYPSDAPWRYAYLLNSPTDFVDPDFASWLRENWDEVKILMNTQKPDWLTAGKNYIDRNDIEGLFAPRALYGEYLTRKVRLTLDNKRLSGLSVRMLCDVVTEIKSEAQQFKVITQLGEILIADRVLIAPGGPANRPMPLSNPDIKRYYASLYGNETAIVKTISDIRMQRNHSGDRVKVACIGANASMLDMLRLLQSCFDENIFEFIAIAPSALAEPILPKKPRETYLPRIKELAGPFATATNFLTAVDTEVAYAREQGYAIAELRSGFVEFFKQNPLSVLLLCQDQARIAASQLEPRFRRGTRDSIEDFRRLSAVGTTRLIGGMVTAIHMATEGDSDRAQLQIEYRTEQDVSRQQEVDLLVNCAGPLPITADHNSLDPLTQQMINKGWLSVCPITRGIQVSEQLETQKAGVYYLSPGVSVVGKEPLAFPLYDVQKLPQLVLKNYALSDESRSQPPVNKSTKNTQIIQSGDLKIPELLQP